ncbi:hypothetical protein HAHE_21660 [Haloferula helveola]|uniref:Peptidylprolyl isomerase n=1 Tax=Haloferula helveola TaxID=490095 RepID=A0ABM7RCR0_9BACT|nr:hypothetical protein HAHE_21660 [Haloferula helveola]
MKSCGWIPPVLAIAVLLSSCDPTPPAPSEKTAPPDAVAKVGDRWILESDIDFAIESGRAIDKSSALEMLIEDELFAAMARREKLDDEPSVRAAQRRMLASRYLESAPDPEPTEADLKAAWEALPSAGAAWAVTAVLRQRITSDREAAVANLETAREEWLGLADPEKQRGFGALAVKFSDDADTRYQGGSLGRVTRGQPHLILPEELVEWATGQTGPALSKIEVIGDSAWLIRVSEVGKPGKRPFEEMAPELKVKWKAEAMREAQQKRFSEAAEEVSIERLVEFEEKRASKPATPEPPSPER